MLQGDLKEASSVINESLVGREHKVENLNTKA